MTEEQAARIERYKAMQEQNKRRAALGIKVNIWDAALDSTPDYFLEDLVAGYNRGNSSVLSRVYLGGCKLKRSDRWEMLRRAKSYLSRRSFADVDESLLPSRYGNKREFVTVLDCFPALKHSYSSYLPDSVIARRRGSDAVSAIDYVDISCAPNGSSKRARVNDISRSSSIRLDPVDSPRQLYIYRKRIQRCIAWAYCNGLVPVMMTLTVFHRWHPLRGLLEVLSRAWNHFFTSGRAVNRGIRMGLSGYIRRAEETINNGVDEYNSGWHPHYHVILFVPKDRVSLVSSMEGELRDAWFRSVNKFFLEVFGEEIDSSYESAFRRHGLFFSRVRRSETMSKSPCDDEEEAELRAVDDSEYMAKMVGCDSSSLYGGDKELTSSNEKGSRVPFDLLCEDTAENNDLWVEYALATKGVRSFIFSRGLEKRVADYFEEHPQKDTKKPFVRSTEVVARISRSVYKLLYSTFKLDEMLRTAVRGYEVLRSWFIDMYIQLGLQKETITDDILPMRPGEGSSDDMIDVRGRECNRLVNNHGYEGQNQNGKQNQNVKDDELVKEVDKEQQETNEEFEVKPDESPPDEQSSDSESRPRTVLDLVSESCEQLGSMNKVVDWSTVKYLIDELGVTKSSKASDSSEAAELIAQAYAELEGLDGVLLEDLFPENSPAARADVVSRSKWYPAWYRSGLHRTIPEK